MPDGHFRERIGHPLRQAFREQVHDPVVELEQALRDGKANGRGSNVQGPEIQQGQLDASLRVKRTSGVYELTFGFAGTVKVACDRCLELMDQPIEAEQTLKVRLGDQFEDDGDMVTVPYEDGSLNVAWNLYEFIALEIPIRHVHRQGECPRVCMEISICHLTMPLVGPFTQMVVTTMVVLPS